MDRRLAELRNLNEFATRGRVKSQRGGTGDVPIKRVVDWPQNFILTGTQKPGPLMMNLVLLNGWRDSLDVYRKKSKSVTGHPCWTILAT